MNVLQFLSNAVIEDVTPSSKVKGVGGPKKQRNPNPTLVAIRVWQDGSVYPSQALVEKFDLEFKPAKITREAVPVKDGEDAKFKNNFSYPEGAGNGFDIIDSRKWGQYKYNQHCLFISPSSKTAGKLDLFGTVNADEEGKPTVSVMDQGAATFGSTFLVPALEELYGLVFRKTAKEAVPAKDGKDAQPAVAAVDGIDYVDLIITEVPESFQKSYYTFPKVVSRGDKKGEDTYVRRENTSVFALVKAADVLGEAQDDNENEAEEFESDATQETSNAVVPIV